MACTTCANTATRLAGPADADKDLPLAAPLCEASCLVPIARDGVDLGEWDVQLWSDPRDSPHDQLKEGPVIALVKGHIEGASDVLVRLHSECMTGNTFGSTRCDCHAQLSHAMEMVHAAGSGVVLYIQGHEGRGIGLAAKLRAYALQLQGCDTFEANRRLGLPEDARAYGLCRRILVAGLGIASAKLITNNPHKAAALGLLVTGIVGSHTPVTPHNERYLAAKSEVETRGALQLGLATLFEASRGGATTPTAAQPGALPAAMPHHVAFDSA